MKQISLVNMSDLLVLIKSIVHDNASLSDLGTGLSGIIKARQAFATSHNQFATESIKSKTYRDSISSDVLATAKKMSERRIKNLILAHLFEHADSEFLAPIESSEDPYIIEQMADGIKFYKLDIDKIPQKLLSDIERLNRTLIATATEYINNQLSQPGEFILDSRYLEKDTSDFNKSVANAKWGKNMPDAKSNNELMSNLYSNKKQNED